MLRENLRKECGNKKEIKQEYARRLSKKRQKKYCTKNFDDVNYTCKSHIPTLQDAKLQEISMYRNGRNVMLNLMHIGF